MIWIHFTNKQTKKQAKKINQDYEDIPSKIKREGKKSDDIGKYGNYK